MPNMPAMLNIQRKRVLSTTEQPVPSRMNKPLVPSSWAQQVRRSSTMRVLNTKKQRVLNMMEQSKTESLVLSS